MFGAIVFATHAFAQPTDGIVPPPLVIHGMRVDTFATAAPHADALVSTGPRVRLLSGQGPRALNLESK